MCTEFVIGHIMRLTPTTIFTTRDMLPYGKRGAVDQALCRLVNTDFIVRLARGVFVRDASDKPTLEDIVRAKLNAWNKKVFVHADDLLVKLGVKVPDPNAVAKFAVDGHSSTFATTVGRVVLHGIGPRKVSLCEGISTAFVYALWCLGTGITDEILEEITQRLNRVERELFRRSSSMMPFWLLEQCEYLFPNPQLTI